ncbi:L-type lectin-domain containing receptor kinase IX.1 [Triticum aestivum]|uniref:L-type lectin-domain containing receptor kinase IX.1 n=1 Tax=Triticum aestivum TaxID=4565 RepID=UPI001D0350DB|nr:L-type lectin-domain containing receptor kinase IX.1-like [Triticum aestivum]
MTCLRSPQQGDGMGFFVGPYPASLPTDASGGFLALFNNRGNPANTFFPPTVGVEFDTFRNVDWDPNDTVNHLGVNVNSISSMAYAALPDGSFNGVMSASVRYDAGAATLSATLHMPEQRTYTVSASVDMRAAGLPQDAAVGFSAAIGDLVEQHQILSWSFESTLTVTDYKTSKRKRTGLNLIAGLVSVGVFVLLAVAAWLGYLQYLKRKGKHTQEASEDAEEIPVGVDMDNEFEKGAGPRRFGYGELSRATKGFSDEEKLGEGGFGAVYRGHLHEQGLHVAIKRVSKTSSQGRREYVAEVTIIGRLRHRNLVQLVGWCHEADELLLVYELMTNGSLDDHLYASKSVLAWPARYRIILGMGSALLYLHQEWEQCVVHRDIKPSNVMLDASFNARLGDFGLARLVDHCRGAHTTTLAGTRGYMDPQCAVTSRASAETDVYSFGVVLLEVACGRRPVVPQLEEEDEGRVMLVRWVWELYGRGTLLVDAADARLDGDLDAREMERALVVGLWCVHPDYGFRPSIRQAMSVLQFEAPLPDLPPEMPVATYARAPHRSTYTSSSTGGSSSSTGGRSITSDLTAESRRPWANADTRSATRPIAFTTNQTSEGTRAAERRAAAARLLHAEEPVKLSVVVVVAVSMPAAVLATPLARVADA